MQEDSLNSIRTAHQERLGEAMREVQDAKATADYFDMLVAEIHAKDPASPIEGRVRGATMEWCRQQAERFKEVAILLRNEEQRLRESQP